jgi:hypothetical protein
LIGEHLEIGLDGTTVMILIGSIAVALILPSFFVPTAGS